MRFIHASACEEYSPRPCGIVRVDSLAELMAADAAVVLHQIEPVALLDLLGDVALAAELVGAGIFSIEYQ